MLIGIAYFFLQPAGQHSFTINHQNLGSNVKQME